MNLSPLPIQKFFDSNGIPLAGGQLFTYIAGTTTKLGTFKDQAGTANTNPIILDYRGEANVWLDQTLTYKFTLAPANDTDPPTRPIWTVDNISAAITYASLTQAIIGIKLYPQSPAEAAAGITPTNYYRYYGDVRRYGAILDGSNDDTAAIQAAHNQGAQSTGARPYLPAGQGKITSTITPCQLGMFGDGAKFSRLVCVACDTFTIPSNAGWDRPMPVFERFGIDSNNGTSCDGNWAFKFPGVANGAAVVYNSGFCAKNLAIGRNGRMGGCFYLKDLFGTFISDISVTDATRVVQLVGSVAQARFEKIDALAGSSGAGTTLTSIGFSTESASYASGTLTPEHITAQDVSLIVFDTGLSHNSGLDCNFYDIDVQTKVTGLSIGAPCDLRGAIVIPHTSGVTAWTGVAIGVSPTLKDARFLENIDVTMGNMPGTPASSYGFDMGDGASPVFGVTLRNCSVKGLANSLQQLVRGRLNKDIALVNFHSDAAVALGTEISFSSIQRGDLRDIHCPSGILSVNDNGDATAYGTIQNNEIGTLTLTLTSPQNWNIGPNEGLTPVQAAYETGSFTATLTGCTTSPTGTVVWVKQGRMVTIYIPTIQATSNTTACSFTGLPANLQPGTQQDPLGRGTDNGGNGVTGYRLSPGSGTVNMFFNLGAWTAAGTKGTSSSVFSYML